MNSNAGNDPYICVSVEATQTGFTEEDESDNTMCKPLSSGVFELYDPFYTSEGELSLRYVIPGDGDLTIELISSSGARIQSAEIKGEESGLHTYRFDVHGLATGAYLISVRWKDETKSVYFFAR
jgi:hypothetical protein